MCVRGSSERLRQRPGVVTVSAETGRGVARVLDRVEQLFAKHTAPHPDAGAEPFLQELAGRAQPPSRDPAAQPPVRDQTTARPPRFRFFVNDPWLVTRDYGYWVENQMRERFELEGVPVSIDFVRRS